MKTFLMRVWAFALATMIFSCAKDDLGPSTINLPSDQSNTLRNGNGEQVFQSGGGLPEDTTLIETQLGPDRPNPYTVQNVTDAYNFLYDPDIPSIGTTHQYIRFNPTSFEDLDLLADTDVNLWHFPLGREILQMGDYWDNNGGGDPTQIPPMWAVVKVGDGAPQLPNVSYTILEDLHLKSSDEFLVRKALEMKGYDPDIVGYRIEFDGGDGGGGGTQFENFCGCDVYSNQRKPGGCVRVEDSELNTLLGVRQVKIIIKDAFFTEDETYTDDDGCWKIDDRYSGSAWMWVRWKGNQVKIRGARSGLQAAWQWISPLKDYVGRLTGPRFNRIRVEYNMWTDQGSSAHLHWGASTVNNALYEMHDFTGDDGIIAPPGGLDVYVGRNDRFGYALMESQNPLSASAAAVLQGVSFFTGPFTQLIGIVGWAVAKTYLPDVHVGIRFQNSDRLKRLSYHEFGHAHQFAFNGDNYWDDLVMAEILAGGHGDQNSQDAGFINVVESWAEHLALDYTHRFYGTDNSIAGFGTWQEWEERVRNESPNHIHIGLYHDLIDLQNDPLVGLDEQGGGSGPIDDLVSGYDNVTMLLSLGPNIRTPLAFINDLGQGLPPDDQERLANLLLSY